MKASDRCIALIKEFEGFESHPYADAVGLMTIGYGHLIRGGEQFQVEGLSEEEATALLCKDLEKAESCVLSLVEVDLSQPQFDALCSWVFNLGCGRLRSSTMLRKLNRGDYKGAADEILRWNRAGGHILKGLVRRREAERALFLEA